jgi:membrane associated rhomboid family serine protease
MSGIGFPRWTPVVKILILACVIVWFVELIAGQAFVLQFGLVPRAVTQDWHVWQLVSWIFLHDRGGIGHILFNMLGLWMFGADIENTWGSRQFTKFFFFCGIGSGIILTLLSPSSTYPTVGASGAIYGVLLAFGMLFPNRTIILYIFPIPAKYLVMIFGAFALFGSITSSGGGVSYIAHLGGLLCGFIYIKIFGLYPSRRPGGGSANPITTLREMYARWQRNRLRKKFEVYYNEKHEDNERWKRWKN